MTTDPSTIATEEGAPPEPDAPAEAGTPPVDEGTPESPDPDEPQGEEGGTPEEPSPAEETAFARLRAKYPNMSDDEFHETVAENYWNSTKEISSREKKIQELESALKEAEENTPPPEEEPDEPPPDPQLERLDVRIKSLYDRGQQFQTEQQELLVELPKLDREIAKAEARSEVAAEKLKDGDDYDQRAAAARDKWEARKATLETDKKGLVRQIRDLQYRREQADYEMETLLADKDWMTRVHEQRHQQQKHEEQDLQKFNEEFPAYMDRLITETADRLGAPKSEKIRNSLWKHVNRASTMDFWTLSQKGISNADVPKMVEGHVKEYLEDRDLAGREKFQAKSTSKRKVTARPGTAPAPAAVKPPVPVTQMGSSGRTPGMEAARKYLASRNL